MGGRNRLRRSSSGAGALGPSRRCQRRDGVDATLLVDDPDVSIEDADLFDIAPTILDLMEIEYERTEFDGASLLK